MMQPNSPYAFMYVTHLLGEANIRCRQVKMSRIASCVVATDYGATITVNANLHPIKRLYEVLHMYAHIVLDHLQPGLGVRVEYVNRDLSAISEGLQAQELEAEELMSAWVRGERYDEAFGPLGLFLSSLKHGWLLSKLLLLRSHVAESDKLSALRRRSSGVQRASRLLSVTSVKLGERQCFMNANKRGSQLARSNYRFELGKDGRPFETEPASPDTRRIATLGR